MQPRPPFCADSPILHRCQAVSCLTLLQHLPESGLAVLTTLECYTTATRENVGGKQRQRNPGQQERNEGERGWVSTFLGAGYFMRCAELRQYIEQPARVGGTLLGTAALNESERRQGEDDNVLSGATRWRTKRMEGMVERGARKADKVREGVQGSTWRGSREASSTRGRGTTGAEGRGRICGRNNGEAPNNDAVRLYCVCQWVCSAEGGREEGRKGGGAREGGRVRQRVKSHGTTGKNCLLQAGFHAGCNITQPPRLAQCDPSSTGTAAQPTPSCRRSGERLQ